MQPLMRPVEFLLQRKSKIPASRKLTLKVCFILRVQMINNESHEDYPPPLPPRFQTKLLKVATVMLEKEKETKRQERETTLSERVPPLQLSGLSVQDLQVRVCGVSCLSIMFRSNNVLFWMFHTPLPSTHNVHIREEVYVCCADWIAYLILTPFNIVLESFFWGGGEDFPTRFWNSGISYYKVLHLTCCYTVLYCDLILQFYFNTLLASVNTIKGLENG